MPEPRFRRDGTSHPEATLVADRKYPVDYAFMVRYLTMNVSSDTCHPSKAFALRYRRVNATFYVAIRKEWTIHAE